MFIFPKVSDREHLEVSGHLTIGGMGNCSSTMVKHLDRGTFKIYSNIIR